MASLQERRNKDGVLISYKVSVYRGRDSDGKQLKPYITTFKVEEGWSEKTARKKAEAFAAVYEKSCLEGTSTDARQTFAEYCNYVIDLKENRKTKASTIHGYRGLAKRLNEYIGYMKLKDIRPDHLDTLYTTLSQDGMNLRTGGKLSTGSLLGYHRLIHTVLKTAVDKGVIPFNPADKVTIPSAEKHEVRYFQPEEIAEIIEALEGEPIKWRAMVYLMMTTGARRGEIVGLKWSDVDFNENTIKIVRNVLFTKEKGIYIDTPKTEKGVRKMAIPVEAMRLLVALRRWQGTEKLRLGDYYQDQGFLFPRRDGTPMPPDSINKWLSRFSDRHGLKHINPHAFRHSMASLLCFAGSDLVSISRRLGHAQVSTTANIYAHLIEKADKENADIIGEIFLKKG